MWESVGARMSAGIPLHSALLLEFWTQFEHKVANITVPLISLAMTALVERHGVSTTLVDLLASLTGAESEPDQPEPDAAGGGATQA